MATPPFGDELPGVLSREQLRLRIEGDPPLIADWHDLDSQLQPNGFDLTLRELSRFRGAGTIARENTGRVLPDLTPLSISTDGFWHLGSGAYHVLFNEVVQLPNDLMALGRPRSSLGRCGVSIHTAVWDAGYHGRSTSLLTVSNPDGFRIERDARVLQLVFFGMARAADEGYRGVYQGENLPDRA